MKKEYNIKQIKGELINVSPDQCYTKINVYQMGMDSHVTFTFIKVLQI